MSSIAVRPTLVIVLLAGLVLAACQSTTSDPCGETEEFVTSFTLGDFTLRPQESSLGFDGHAVVVAEGPKLTGVCADAQVTGTLNATLPAEDEQLQGISVAARVEYTSNEEPAAFTSNEKCNERECRYQGNVTISVNDLSRAYCIEDDCKPAYLIPIVRVEFTTPLLEGAAPGGLQSLALDPAVRQEVERYAGETLRPVVAITLVGWRIKGAAEPSPTATATPTATPLVTSTPPMMSTATRPAALARPATPTPTPTATPQPTPTPTPALLPVQAIFRDDRGWEFTVSGQWGWTQHGEPLEGSSLSVTGMKAPGSSDNANCNEGDQWYRLDLAYSYTFQGSEIASVDASLRGVPIHLTSVSQVTFERKPSGSFVGSNPCPDAEELLKERTPPWGPDWLLTLGGATAGNPTGWTRASIAEFDARGRTRSFGTLDRVDGPA